MLPLPLDNNPAMMRCDWLPPTAWAELNDLRAEHIRLLDDLTRISDEGVAYRAKREAAEAKRDEALRAGRKPPAENPAKREAELRELQARGRVAYQALAEHCAHVVAEVQGAEARWLADLDAQRTEAEASPRTPAASWRTPPPWWPGLCRCATGSSAPPRTSPAATSTTRPSASPRPRRPPTSPTWLECWPMPNRRYPVRDVAPAPVNPDAAPHRYSAAHAEARDALMARAVVAGKFPPERVLYWGRRYDADPAGTREIIESLAGSRVPLGAGAPAAEDDAYPAHWLPEVAGQRPAPGQRDSAPVTSSGLTTPAPLSTQATPAPATPTASEPAYPAAWLGRREVRRQGGRVVEAHD